VPRELKRGMEVRPALRSRGVAGLAG